MGLDQWIRWYDLEKETTVEKTYRKENWLRGWMIENTSLDYEDNCEEVPVSIEKIKELYESCQIVLTHRDEKVSEVKLPAHEGFFFGTYDYDDWYYDGVEIVKDDLEEIINNENKIVEITYEDWW